MATREELYTALRNADVAGDNEGAAKLAAYIKSLPAEGTVAPQVAGPSTAENFARQAALTGRNIGQGVVGALTAIPDAAIDVGNMGIRGLNKLGLNIPQQRTFSGSLDELLNMAGAPNPETQAEMTDARVIRTGSGLLTGLGLGRAIQSPNAPALQNAAGKLLSQDPIAQTVSTAGMIGGAEMADRAGLGSTGQTVAALTGAAIPGLGVAGLQAGVRGLARGGSASAQQMRGNIAAAKNAGTELTLGQAAGGRMQSAEATLREIPGARGIFKANDTKQMAEIGSRMEAVANRNDAMASPATAGRGVEAGIFGKDTGWLDRTKAQQTALYEKVDKALPQTTRVGVSNTKERLAALNEPIAGAENLSANQFTNANIKGIEGAVKADTEGVSSVRQNASIPKQMRDTIDLILNPRNTPRETGIVSPRIATTEAEKQALIDGLVDGKLPLEALHKLRTAVGEFLDDPALSAQVKANKYKPLYEALTKDLETAYKSDKSGAAYKAWKDANDFTADRHRVVDLINNKVSRDVPESIYTSLMAGAKDGDTLLKTTLDNVPPEARQVFADTVLKRLGRKASGESVADAGDFDAAKFVADWGKLSPEAKSTLFGSVSSPMRKLINDAEQTSKRINIRGDSLPHAPGLIKETARGLASLTGIPYGLGKAFTSPKTVNWLAQPTQVKDYPNAAQMLLFNQGLGQ